MKALKIIAISLLLVLASSPALAAKSRVNYERNDPYQQPSIYLGLNIGKTSTDIPNNNNSATSFSLFAGYSFNRFVSTELAFPNLGNLEMGTILGNKVTMRMTAASLSIVGYIPMGQTVSLYGKAGFASTSTQVEWGSTVGNAYSQSGATIGAGVQFNISKHMNIRLAYDNYKINTGTTTYNANVPNVAFMVRF